MSRARLGQTRFKIDVPCHVSLAPQAARDRASRAPVCIIEVIDAMIAVAAGRYMGRRRTVLRTHRDPDDHHAEVGARKGVEDALPDRPGTGETLGSRWRQKREHPNLSALRVETRDHGVERTAERDEVHGHPSGPIIRSGLTMWSNSSPESRPSSTTASRRVLPS